MTFFCALIIDWLLNVAVCFNMHIQQGDIEIWTRPIIPTGSYAFALLNLGTATPTKVSFVISDLGFHNTAGYNVTEVFDSKYIGLFKPTSRLTMSVNPSGVFFGKATVMSADDVRLHDDESDDVVPREDHYRSDRL